MSSIRLKPSTVRSPPASTNQQFHSRPTEIANLIAAATLLRVSLCRFQRNMSPEGENKLLKLKQNPKLSSFASEKHSFGFLLVSLPPTGNYFSKTVCIEFEVSFVPKQPEKRTAVNFKIVISARRCWSGEKPSRSRRIEPDLCDDFPTRFYAASKMLITRSCLHLNFARVADVWTSSRWDSNLLLAPVCWPISIDPKSSSRS